jgi:hypothetical protein
LTVREILRGQLLALMRQFLGPLVLVIAVGCLFAVASFSDNDTGSEHAFWGSIWLGGMVMLVADLAALYWVGMWQALIAKSPNHAARGNVARILVVPSIIFALLLLGDSLIANRRGSDPSWKFLLGCWFGLGLAADIGFGAWARHKLLSDFRLAAAQRYAPGAGFWKRLLAGGETASRDVPPVVLEQK